MCYRLISFLCLPFWLIAYPTGVELSWSRTECYPGDTVELRASGAFSELSTYELRLPQHEALHLVAHQRQPVHYEDGVYLQRDVWVLQPLYSGTIELGEILVLVRQGGELSEELRAVPPLTVQSYVDYSDSPEPQPLPEDRIAGAQEFGAWLVGLFGLLAVGLFFVLRFRKAGRELVAESQEASLADVRAALVGGMVPVELIEQLLADQSVSLSTNVRAAFEGAVYGKLNDTETLVEVLDREEAS